MAINHKVYPGDIAHEIEQYAEENDLSVSELYTEAAREYIGAD